MSSDTVDAVCVEMFQFLGHVEVDQPKGSDMVRDAIRKMKVCSWCCICRVLMQNVYYSQA